MVCQNYIRSDHVRNPIVGRLPHNKTVLSLRPQVLSPHSPPVGIRPILDGVHTKHETVFSMHGTRALQQCISHRLNQRMGSISTGDKHNRLIRLEAKLMPILLPEMAPADYRRLIKPHEAELLAEIRQHTAAKIFFHSDGNIYPLLGDLIEIGVDVINPVQVSAGSMADTARLKREFGDRLSFCGAIDTNSVLPRGSAADVRREVQRRLRDLAPGGGYIAAAVHCIQPDVPPENVVAMCAAVRELGVYPLSGSTGATGAER